MTSRGLRARVESHLDRDAALQGSDAIVVTVMVGGLEATRADLAIPLQAGLRQTIGDTLGVGGIFRGLRTAGFYAQLAADVRRLCPAAWILNYTNPMAINIDLMSRLAPSSTSSACATPCTGPSTPSAASSTCRWPRWSSRRPASTTSRGSSASSATARTSTRSWTSASPPTRSCAVACGSTCTAGSGTSRRSRSEHSAEYVAWYLPHQAQVERFRLEPGEYIGISEQNLAEYHRTAAAVADGHPLDFGTEAVEYAPQVIHSLATGTRHDIYATVPNRGWIDNLPAEAAVEVPVTIEGREARPQAVGALPEACAALNRRFLDVVGLTVDAALSGDPELVRRAALLDPQRVRVARPGRARRRADRPLPGPRRPSSGRPRGPRLLRRPSRRTHHHEELTMSQTPTSPRRRPVSALGRRRTAGLAVAMAGSLLLAACGESTTGGPATDLDQASPDDKVTLTWWTGQDDSSEVYIDKLVDQFEAEHPNVTIKATPGSATTDDLLGQLSASFAGGTYPDISYAYGSWASELADSGRTLDLTDTIAEDDDVSWDEFSEAARATAAPGGKTIGFPAVVDNLAVVYNKDLLAEAGLDEPSARLDVGRLPRLREGDDGRRRLRHQPLGVGRRGHHLAVVAAALAERRRDPRRRPERGGVRLARGRGCPGDPARDGGRRPERLPRPDRREVRAALPGEPDRDDGHRAVGDLRHRQGRHRLRGATAPRARTATTRRSRVRTCGSSTTTRTPTARTGRTS